MARYRSILSLTLVIVAIFLVSCGGPTTAKAPETYTPTQIAQIQEYVPNIMALRDRMTTELQPMLQRRDWTDVRNFIHGPLGEMRLQLTYAARNFLPPDQQKARQLIRDFFDNLVQVDQAAEQADIKKVALNYQEALNDIDAFLQLAPPLPQAPETDAES